MNQVIENDATPAEPRPTCDSCMFFEAGEIDPNNVVNRQYFCKRNPPQPCVLPAPAAAGQMNVQITSVYPMTAPVSWCGEWDDGHEDEPEPEPD